MDHSTNERSAECEMLVIVCAYPEGMLPSSWFQVYKRLRRKVKRGLFRARVELLPITEVPSRIDVLVVPPALADAADAVTVTSERLVGQGDELQEAFDRLVMRLVDEGRLGRGGSSGRALAVHRGFQALGERARSAD